MEKRVYLLEDDKNIGELVKCALEMSNITIECYETIADFMAAVEKQELFLFDLRHLAGAEYCP